MVRKPYPKPNAVGVSVDEKASRASELRNSSPTRPYRYSHHQKLRKGRHDSAHAFGS